MASRWALSSVSRAGMVHTVPNHLDRPMRAAGQCRLGSASSVLHGWLKVRCRGGTSLHTCDWISSARPAGRPGGGRRIHGPLYRLNPRVISGATAEPPGRSALDTLSLANARTAMVGGDVVEQRLDAPQRPF